MSDVKDYLPVLMEFNWDFNITVDPQLLNIAEYKQEEIETIKEINKYVKRCKLEKINGQNKITVDYIFPDTEFTEKVSIMNKFVTTSLIRQIAVTAKNPKDFPVFSYNCILDTTLPDWHITFGTKPNALTLTVVYDIDNLIIN